MMRAHSAIPALGLLLTGFLMLPASLAAQTPNTTTVDPDGTAHITRTVPVPNTLSPEAQATLRNGYTNLDLTLEQRRTSTDKWQTGAGEKSRQVYPVHIADAVIAGVPVRDVMPLTNAHKDWVLICLHGGGFNSDSGSFTESIPMANLLQARVVSVLYRLAPEHPYPAALDDAVAVYKDLLKTHKPAHIVIYGTSAGAILTAEVASRLKQLGLPQPAALGIFSGLGDFSANGGDAAALFALQGLRGNVPLPAPLPGSHPRDTSYTGTLDPKDPVLSPVYADLHGLPPTLFITSGRDMLLSGTTILHRAYLRAGVDARLIVFEGLSHAFWNDVALPESKETYGYMADFFRQQLSKH